MTLHLCDARLRDTSTAQRQTLKEKIRQMHALQRRRGFEATLLGRLEYVLN